MHGVISLIHFIYKRMERGNVNVRIEYEASNMPPEAEVEQLVHINIEPEPK